MPRAKRTYLTTPMLLVTVGTYLLIGCIYIPSTRQFMPNGKQRPEMIVGAANSKKSIRFGETRIMNAIAVLNEQLRGNYGMQGFIISNPVVTFPPYRNWQVLERGKRYALAYKINKGYWVWPLCFYSSADVSDRFMILDVNDTGIVTGSMTVENLNEWPIEERRMLDGQPVRWR